ncbi:MAG: hypothetical protein IPL86_07565 [Flavobacteriales bacterium]|nr:hypothetical protein [Flavobacteriales bacterium]
MLDLQRRTIAEPVTDNKGMAILPYEFIAFPFLNIGQQGNQRGYWKPTTAARSA